MKPSPVARKKPRGTLLMDTELAKTFLSVVSVGNFVKAGERLFVTQSTVSARIQSLEQQLGCRLFERNKGGTTLTPAGKRFQKHAVNLMRTVQQAREDVGTPTGYRASLTIGGRFGIWDDLLVQSLARIRSAAPDVAIRAEIGFEDDLMQGLVEGRIDIGIMYTPQHRPGLNVEILCEEDLVLVSTDPNESGQIGSTYIYVDWGPEFHAKHQSSFPEFIGPGLSANVGWLALQHVLHSGGSGYFPERLVSNYLRAGRLHRISDAPFFRLPVHVVYPSDRDKDMFDVALTAIRRVTAETLGSSQVARSLSEPEQITAQNPATTFTKLQAKRARAYSTMPNRIQPIRHESSTQ
jgi:LysR family transcriptional regulator, flagellar master operon regulator